MPSTTAAEIIGLRRRTANGNDSSGTTTIADNRRGPGHTGAPSYVAPPHSSYWPSANSASASARSAHPDRSSLRGNSRNRISRRRYPPRAVGASHLRCTAEPTGVALRSETESDAAWTTARGPVRSVMHDTDPGDAMHRPTRPRRPLHAPLVASIGALAYIAEGAI